MDRIRIQEIEVNAIIGTLPHERTVKQKLIVSAELRGNFRAAALADDFTLTFDYSEAERIIADFVASSGFYLLEALAEHLTRKLLSMKYVESVLLRIRKPGAPQIARGIELEIERFRMEKCEKTQ